jgi:hypothetical protein
MIYFLFFFFALCCSAAVQSVVPLLFLPSFSPLISMFPRRLLPSVRPLFSSFSRSFSQHPVPVGERLHGNLYVRPSVPVPDHPLTDDHDFTWDDDQAPEPVFDVPASIPNRAAFHLLGMIVGVFGFVGSLAWLINPGSPTVPIDFSHIETAESVTKDLKRKYEAKNAQ